MIIKDINEVKRDGVIVSTNGCFDLLHPGHIETFRLAKEMGDILVVGINTDASVQRLKGSSRPIKSQGARAIIVDAIKYVDYVFLFDDDTPCNWIQKLQPDIHVKGGDYSPTDYENMPEAKIIHGYGGKVHIVRTVGSYSTSSYIKKIQNETTRKHT